MKREERADAHSILRRVRVAAVCQTIGFIVFLLFVLIMLAPMEDDVETDVIAISVVFGGVIAGLFLWRLIENRRLLGLYRLYAPLLEKGTVFPFKSLAAQTARPEERIRRDFPLLMRKGLVRNATIDDLLDAVVFPGAEGEMVGGRLQNVRRQIVICPGCGAKCNVVIGRTTYCEYCGGALNAM